MLKYGYHHYPIDEIIDKKRIEAKKIAFLIFMVILIMGLILVAENSRKIMSQYKVYQQYEAQIIALNKQEEYKKTEQERKRKEVKQEKIPKLTKERKKKLGKHLPCREEKSIFNI